MNLFLASQASETLDLLVPHLAKKPVDMHVVVVTTASNLYDNHPWLDNDIAKLHELRFNTTTMDIAKMSPYETRQQLDGVDLIFVAGGNTSYLLEQSHKSGFFELAQQHVTKNTWYVGSSAGTVIAGPDIEYDKLYDEGEFGKILDSYEGFNFIEFIPLPHADSSTHKLFIDKALKQFGSKFDMRKLADKQAYLIKGNHVQLLQKE